MHCDVCHGMGTTLYISFPSGEPMPRPCRACNGSGLAHCCEGERPDADAALRELTAETERLGLYPWSTREHTASPDCWCNPTEDPLAPGLFIHNRPQ